MNQMNQMNQTRYRITNATVKPKRIDKKSGKDLRSTIERRGHPVQWRDAKGNVYSVNPGGNSRFVSEVPEGLLRLARGGLVAIEEFTGGVTEQMKQHTLGARTASTTEVKTAAAAEKTEEEAKNASEGDSVPTKVDDETPAAPGETQPEEILPANQDAVNAAAKAAPAQKVGAVEMGKDDHGEGKEGDSTGYPGAVNPDGADKHTVVAGNHRTTKKKTSKKKGRR